MKAWRPTPDAVRQVNSAAGRLLRNSSARGMDADDLRQIGLIALWQAGDADALRPFVLAHAAMVDELRRVSHGRMALAPVFVPLDAGGDDDAPREVADASAHRPEEWLQARRMLDALAALPDPWPARIEALTTTPDKRAAAAALGVSPARVSQYLGQLREVLAGV